MIYLDATCLLDDLVVGWRAGVDPDLRAVVVDLEGGAMSQDFAKSIGDIVIAFDWACQGDEFDTFSFLNALDAIADLLTAYAKDMRDA